MSQDEEDKAAECDWTTCGYCGEEYYGEVDSIQCLDCYINRDEEE